MTSGRRTHAFAAVCGFLTAAAIAVLCQIVSSPPQSQIARTDQTGSVDLVALASPAVRTTQFGVPASFGLRGQFAQHRSIQRPHGFIRDPIPVAWPIPPGPPGPKTKGAVATPEELAVKDPTLYVYDHCPFCVRARMIFGLKHIPYNLVFLQNDDVKTPTRLIGKKITPILEDPANGVVMPESLDIVKYMDKGSMLMPETGRPELKTWSKKLGDVRSKLTRPRVGQSLLPEFGSRNAATVWVNNHQIKDGTTYDEAMAKTQEYIQVVNEALWELDDMIASPEYISPGGVSYDDIVYFPLLRSLTIVKGITWPPLVLDYMETMSKKSEVPMLWQLAF